MMTYRGIICLVGMTFLLIGCPQNEKKSKKNPPISRLNLQTDISEFLHAVTPIPLSDDVFKKEEPLGKEESLQTDEVFVSMDPKEDFFSSEKSILHPFQSKDAQSRRYSHLKKRKTAGVWYQKRRSSEKEFKMQDLNYQVHLTGIGEDVSSFPVKGTRVITADCYIPVVLENSINSQLGGRFIVIVETHIFAHKGRGILLPKGTRLICMYESLVKEGDTRLGARCLRAIRPDGASVLLTNAYGADQMARTGMVGRVDNRAWEKYGSAFMVAGISALSAAGANTAQNSVVNQSASNLSVNLGQITAGMLNANIDLAPVMTVAAGSHLQIIPMTDIWLREPEEVVSQNSEDNL